MSDKEQNEVVGDKMRGDGEEEEEGKEEKEERFL